MTITAATSRRRVPGHPLKSSLAVAGGYRSPEAGPAVDAAPGLASAVLSDREATLAEFEDHLRTVNSREGRPYALVAAAHPARDARGCPMCDCRAGDLFGVSGLPELLRDELNGSNNKIRGRRDLLAPVRGRSLGGRVLSRWGTGPIETCRWGTGPIAGGLTAWLRRSNIRYMRQ
jgi:hypothetical protein